MEGCFGLPLGLLLERLLPNGRLVSGARHHLQQVVQVAAGQREREAEGVRHAVPKSMLKLCLYPFKLVGRNFEQAKGVPQAGKVIWMGNDGDEPAVWLHHTLEFGVVAWRENIEQ